MEPRLAVPMIRFGALVLFAADPDRTTRFYQAAGIALDREDHGEGPVHSAADVDGVHFAIFPAEADGTPPRRRAAGDCLVGFYVDSLERTEAALRAAGGRFASPHETMPWGCRFVALDPDGRAVEINQRDHCPAPRGSA